MKMAINSILRSGYVTAIPPQKTQNEIRPPFYTPPGSREGTQLRNENNNSSYKPAPPPRKSAFDIKNHTNPPKVSHTHNFGVK